MQILADASLPNVQKHLGACFDLTLYSNHAELLAKIAKADFLVCRSTLKVTADLLANTKISCIATASSGTDHIDKIYLENQGIRLIDAKGTNAHAVCDYVFASLALLTKRSLASVQKIVIVGAGEVGSLLASRFKRFSFTVSSYDPPKALRDKDFISCDIKELYSADLICLHADLHNNQPHPSQNLFDKELLAKLRQGVVIINAARGGIVNEDSLLENNNNIVYCADVYCTEPQISSQIVDYAQICTPHIAGHSIEAKDLAVSHIADCLRKCYLENQEAHGFVNQLSDNGNSDLQFQHPPVLESILQQYDPTAETLALKAAQDKKEAFLSLRKKHSFRHNFCGF